jgi:hypothetical protein
MCPSERSTTVTRVIAARLNELCLASAVALMCFTSTNLTAQRTWVVDVFGGPGAHFTEVQPAIDTATPGDIILVRPGATAFYQGFVVSKGLTITTESRGWWLRINPDIVVRGLPRGQTVMLKHLGAWGTGSVILEDNAGSVYVEKCQTGSQGGRLIVRGSASVALNEVASLAASIESSYVTFNRGINDTGVAALPALWVSRSVVVFGNSVLLGSRANYSLGECKVLYPPGDAIAGYDSLLILGAGTQVIGGRLSVFGGGCPPIFLEAMAITGSNIRVIKDPQATLGFVSGSVTVQTSPQPTLDARVADEIRGRMDFDLWGTPGSPAAMVASLPRDPIGTPYGFQWANLNAYLVADTGLLDATGHRKVSFLLPAAYPLGQPMVFQSIVLERSGPTWSTPSAIIKN